MSDTQTENVRLAEALADAIPAARAAQTAYRAAYQAEVDQMIADEVDPGVIPKAAEARVPAAIRDEQARENERLGRLDRELQANVAGGITAGVWKEGARVWTPDSIVAGQPLVVSEIRNGDTPIAHVNERGETVEDFLLASIVLTGDGFRIAQAQHIPTVDADDETVPFEIWGGGGFQRGGTVHPRTRGWVEVGRLG